MNFFVTAAMVAKKRQDDEARARRYREGRAESFYKHEEELRSGSMGASISISEYPYIKCVLKEMAREIERPREGKITLFGFCEEFDKVFKLLSLEDVATLMHEAEEIEKQYKQVKEQVEALEKQLGDEILGNEIVCDILYRGLSDEELKADRPTKMPTLTKKAEDLSDKIKNLRRKMFFMPFGQKDNKKLLEQFKAELSKTYDEIHREREIQRLSPQDKENTREYIQLYKERKRLEQELRYKKCKIEDVKECRARYDYNNFEMRRDRWERTLGRMLNEGKISEQDLDKIFRILDKVGIKACRCEYNFKIWSSDTDGRTEKYEAFLEWFIEDIYENDESFVDRNLGYGHEEEEQH